MNPAVQNGLLAAGYGVVFFAVLNSRSRSKFRLLMVGSAFAALYNLGYEWSVQWRLATSLALLFRLLPPLEACWLVERRKRYNLAFAGMLCAAILGSVRFDGAYLVIRNVATVGMSLLAWTVFALNWRKHANPFYFRHLALQAFWMTLHAGFSLAFRWYRSTWDEYTTARWLYIAFSLVIVVAYQHLFSCPPVQGEGEAAAGPQFSQRPPSGTH